MSSNQENLSFLPNLPPNDLKRRLECKSWREKSEKEKVEKDKTDKEKFFSIGPPILHTARKNPFHENCVCSYKSSCTHHFSPEIRAFLKRGQGSGSVSSNGRGNHNGQGLARTKLDAKIKLTGIMMNEEQKNEVRKFMGEEVRMRTCRDQSLVCVDNKMMVGGKMDVGEEAGLFEVVPVPAMSSNSMLVFVKSMATGKYLSVLESKPYELIFLSGTPGKFQTFEVVAAAEQNHSSSDSNLVPNEYCSPLYALRSIYGRFVGLDLGNVFNASRNAIRPTELLYLAKSVPFVLHEKMDKGVQTRLINPIIESFQSMIATEIHHLAFSDETGEQQEELIQLSDYLAAFQFDPTENITLRKIKLEDEIDASYSGLSLMSLQGEESHGSQRKASLASIDDAIVFPTVSLSTRKQTNSAKKNDDHFGIFPNYQTIPENDDDPEDSAVLNMSVASAALETSSGQEIRQIEPETDKEAYDAVCNELLEWLNNKGVAISSNEKRHMEVIAMDHGNTNVVLVHDEDQVHTYTLQKKSKLTRMSSIAYLEGLNDINFQSENKVFEDTVAVDYSISLKPEVSIQEVKPEFYFFIQKRAKNQLISQSAEIEHIKDLGMSFERIHFSPEIAVNLSTETVRRPERMVIEEPILPVAISRTKISTTKIQLEAVKSENDNLKIRLAQMEHQMEMMKCINKLKVPHQVTKFHQHGKFDTRFIRISADEKYFEWSKTSSFITSSSCLISYLREVRDQESLHNEPNWINRPQQRLSLFFSARSVDFVTLTFDDAQNWKHALNQLLH